MAGTKQRDLRKEFRWRKRLERQQASGSSVRQYCLSHGLYESAFYYWRREIERRDLEANGAKGAFVPVVVETAKQIIEVVLASGHVVRVPPGFDGDTLQQLLALLEERAC